MSEGWRIVARATAAGLVAAATTIIVTGWNPWALLGLLAVPVALMWAGGEVIRAGLAVDREYKRIKAEVTELRALRDERGRR